MTNKIIDGKIVAKQIKEEITLKVQKLKKQKRIVPGLAIVLVGDGPASHSYVRSKEKACKEVGFYSEVYRLKEIITQEELLGLIHKLNQDEKIHGILVQLPLPRHIDENIVNENIDPKKDVDGFHPINLGKLFLEKPNFISCTSKGIIRLLKQYSIPIEGKNAVVIGRNNIVGKPVAMLLMQENAIVTICDSHTKDLTKYLQQADIIISSIDEALFITEGMVKEGAVVIDAGNARVNDKLTGDVDYKGVFEKVSMITPVPGGVGPMIIAMLLENTLESFLKIQN